MLNERIKKNNSLLFINYQEAQEAIAKGNRARMKRQ
jgi:hypothetical protein